MKSILPSLLTGSLLQTLRKEANNMNLRQHFHLILPLVTVLILSTVVCAEPSLTATNATLGTDRPIRVHFIAFSEVSYHDPYKTFPAFAEVLHREYGMQCTLSLSKKKDHFPDNLKAMADADLLVMFCRHMAKLPTDQSQLLHAWCEAGKPIVAIRTSTHAFDDWKSFGADVLGGYYKGHTGLNKGLQVIVDEKAKDHPVLRGVQSWACTGANMIYQHKINKKATILLNGKFPDKTSGPLVWVYEYNVEKGGRILYSTLGIPCDFEEPNFKTVMIQGIFWTLKQAVPQPHTSGQNADGVDRRPVRDGLDEVIEKPTPTQEKPR